MTKVRSCKLSWFAVAILIALGSLTITPGTIAQTTTVTGKVTLKQADGTEVPVTAKAGPGSLIINGANAISGATVFSDSTVTTAKGSSAVVSLGKLGRVEVHSDTTVKLSFADSSITAMLEAGRVRVSSSSGVNATTTTNDGTITSKDPKKNEFIVDVSCGNTFVAVLKGSVELRAGETVKQIAAGSQDTAGTGRPGCTSSDKR